MRIKVIHLIILLLTAVRSLADTTNIALIHPDLVNTFYLQNNKRLFWFNDNIEASRLRASFIQLLDSCEYQGLDKHKYHYSYLNNINNSQQDKSNSENADYLFTDAAIAYLNDLYQGNNISTNLSYDEISQKFHENDTDILTQLAQADSKEKFINLIIKTEPSNPEYNQLKTELHTKIDSNKTDDAKQIQTTLNTLRWVYHFNFDKFILINIAATTLKCYSESRQSIFMKIVAGKPSTKTPLFAAYCNQIIYYPYWHVPRSIAVKEILPLCKKSPAYPEKIGLQIINSKGNVINPYSINWAKLNRNNFNYTFRQGTGCDNALGVIKFNLTDPFNVYLHDTNQKKYFSLNRRFLSHGCMRVEKPVALAEFVSGHTVDTSFLAACIKGQKPVLNNIDEPVPVFVVYMTADTDSTNFVKYYEDVYHLAK